MADDKLANTTDDHLLFVDDVELEESFGDFEREEVGYYPYFTPMLFCGDCKKQITGRDMFCAAHPNAEMIGNRFFGTVIAVDENLDEPDPKQRFVRFTLQSQAKAFNAQSGPKAAPEVVAVKKGEFFTVGEYGTLPLRRYMGKTLLVSVTGKRPPSAKNPKHSPSFVFDVRVDKATKNMLDKERAELTRLALEAHKNKQLAAAGIAPSSLGPATSHAALPPASSESRPS